MSKSTKTDSQYGPVYPAMPGLNRYRRRAHAGLRNLSPTERHDYGAAVEQAIRALQRAELSRACSTAANPPINCASGTRYTTGEEIHEAIRRQQRTALLAAAAKERRQRPNEEWERLYAEAMEQKRKSLVAI